MMLNQIPGVVENGLFIDICDTVVVGHSDGRTEMRDLAEDTVTEDRTGDAEDENLFRDIGD